MTKDEALMLVLEALYLIAHNTTDDPRGQAYKAITAIKEALAKPERDYERGFIDGMQKQMQSSVDKAVNRMAQPEQAPVANGKLQVTLQDTPTEIELAQYKSMFKTVCAELGAINEALGLDPNDGGAEPILFAIEELRGRSQEPVGKFAKFIDNIWREVTDGSAGVPLYTTPPQRTWVSLTDEEIYKIAFALEGEHWRKIADAIEAKLKEKNA